MRSNATGNASSGMTRSPASRGGLIVVAVTSLAENRATSTPNTTSYGRSET